MAEPEPGARNAKEEPGFPMLTRLRAMDRQDHIQKGLEAGLDREQAEKHADEDLAEREDERP